MMNHIDSLPGEGKAASAAAAGHAHRGWMSLPRKALPGMRRGDSAGHGAQLNANANATRLTACAATSTSPSRHRRC